MNAPLTPRVFRISLVSLALLGVLLLLGWLLTDWAMQIANSHGSIELDGESIHLGAGEPLQWLMAGVGLLIALAVVIVVVPIVVVVALAVPVLLLLALLAVPVLLAALVLSPILLLLWLLYKLVA